MIISKTPYRISFFGGGSDYPTWYRKYGGEVISSSIDKYLYISLRELPNFFNHNYRISYSKTEEVKEIKNIKHLVVRNLLKHLKWKSGLEIHYDGDLPARSGMASSSAFIVGMANSLIYEKKKNRIAKKELAKFSYKFEQNVLKENVGSQDQIACAYGGFNSIKFYKDGSFKVTKIGNDNFINTLNKNLLLFYTGKQRTAEKIAKTFINLLPNEKKDNVLEILNIVKEAKKIISSSDHKLFGKLLGESWKIKKSLSSHISDSKIDSIYDEAVDSGALGGKILGAGGGGFMLFYVPQSKQKKVLLKLKKLTHIPFTFSKKGSEIVKI
jgi:D-glycero-alpha-D-manno-heptose-7-phosphate kinase